MSIFQYFPTRTKSLKRCILGESKWLEKSNRFGSLILICLRGQNNPETDLKCLCMKFPILRPPGGEKEMEPPSPSGPSPAITIKSLCMFHHCLLKLPVALETKENFYWDCTNLVVAVVVVYSHAWLLKMTVVLLLRIWAERGTYGLHRILSRVLRIESREGECA